MGDMTSGERPRNRLAEMRARRGWSQAQLVAALRKAAHDQGEDLPSPRSLQQLLSRWENNHQAVTPRYRRLLTAVFGCSEAELGLTPLDDDGEGRSSEEAFAQQADELTASLARASSLCRAGVDTFCALTDRLRLRDREGGAEHLLHQLRGHQGDLQEAMRYSVMPDVRRRLAMVLADTAALHAWHALDMGQLVRSWDAFDVAEAAAKLADHPPTEAFVAAEKAYALLDIGRPQEARLLIDHVHGVASPKVPALLASWLSAARGEIFAAMGNDAECRSSLDLAADRIADADPEPDLPFVVLDDHHLARWRGHCLARLGDPEAVAHLEGSLQALDLSFVRARSSALVDLAAALAIGDDLPEAGQRLAEARFLAVQAGSGRQLRRIEVLRRRHDLLLPRHTRDQTAATSS